MPFDFLQFWKKAEAKSKIPVSKIPLFSTLGPQELALVEDKIRLVEYKKGDIVFRIGEEPEAFYIILSGRFRVIGPKGNTLITLSQGDYFGESSILVGRTHSATIEAKNDGLALRIAKNDFLTLLNEIPSLSLHLGRTLGHRLALGPKGREVAETKIISVCSLNAESEKNSFLINLAAMLVLEGKKQVVAVLMEHADQAAEPRKVKAFVLQEAASGDFDAVRKAIEEFKGGFHFLNLRAGPAGTDNEKQVALLLTSLAEHYDFVLLNLPAVFGEVGVKAIQQSDLIYFLTGEKDRDSSEAERSLEEFKTSFGFTPDKIRWILCEQKDHLPDPTLAQKSGSLAASEIFFTLPLEDGLLTPSHEEIPFVLSHPESGYSKSVRFLARGLTGSLVGLALGSGAAFGFAHIGVIRVLEREHIPVDIVAGSSIGALIAAFWASGLNADAMEEIASGLTEQSVFFKLIGFRDFSLPHHGFFKGNQIGQFLKSYLGAKTFRDLHMPLKVVTANLFTGEEVIIDEGNVADAVRASISIPGIFRPTSYNGQYLIDGGVVDPLPIKVLNRYGVKKIIAVNVLSAPEEHLQRKGYYEAKRAATDALAAKKNPLIRLWVALRGRVIRRYRPNIFNVLMNTIQFLEYGIADSASSEADIVIRPVLTDAHWAEFYSAVKFIRIGEEKAKEQLAEMKQLVEEKS